MHYLHDSKHALFTLFKTCIIYVIPISNLQNNKTIFLYQTNPSIIPNKFQ